MNKWGIHWERQNAREVEWRQNRLATARGWTGRERERKKLIQAHLVNGAQPERQRTGLLEVENEKNKSRTKESRGA